MLVDGTSLGLGVLLERVQASTARAKAAAKATAAKATAAKATAAKATAAKPKARPKVDVDAGHGSRGRPRS